jgi:putative hydrolase of the HAD superfamily
MGPKKTPKAVIFDFGGVLCFHPPDEQFAPLARIFGLTTAVFIPLFWARRIQYDAGQVDARAYWSGIAVAAGVAFDEDSLPALIRGEIELWNNYDERVLDWAAHLKASGYRTGILSNLPRVLGEELRATTGFLDPFQHVTFSYELGSVKPESAIYEDAIRGLGVAPGEALFLDDRPENVQGARAVGLLAEVFNTWEEFLESSLKGYDLPAPPPQIRARIDSSTTASE